MRSFRNGLSDITREVLQFNTDYWSIAKGLVMRVFSKLRPGRAQSSNEGCALAVWGKHHAGMSKTHTTMLIFESISIYLRHAGRAAVIALMNCTFYVAESYSIC